MNDKVLSEIKRLRRKLEALEGKITQIEKVCCKCEYKGPINSRMWFTCNDNECNSDYCEKCSSNIFHCSFCGSSYCYMHYVKCEKIKIFVQEYQDEYGDVQKRIRKEKCMNGKVCLNCINYCECCGLIPDELSLHCQLHTDYDPIKILGYNCIKCKEQIIKDIFVGISEDRIIDNIISGNLKDKNATGLTGVFDIYTSNIINYYYLNSEYQYYRKILNLIDESQFSNKFILTI